MKDFVSTEFSLKWLWIVLEMLWFVYALMHTYAGNLCLPPSVFFAVRYPVNLLV